MIFVFYRLTFYLYNRWIETKVEKMAANTKVCRFKWPGLYSFWQNDKIKNLLWQTDKMEIFLAD